MCHWFVETSVHTLSPKMELVTSQLCLYNIFLNLELQCWLLKRLANLLETENEKLDDTDSFF